MMRFKSNVRLKRIILVYAAVIAILYFIIYIVPRISDIFETTQILKVGNITVSCDTEGYVVKDEAVSLADASGRIEYLVNEGTIIKKGHETAEIDGNAEDREVDRKYEDCMEALKGYKGVSIGTEAPISGVFSLSVDGCEKYFHIDNIDNIKKKEAEDMKIRSVDLKRDEVAKGEPVFKVSKDEVWYVVCWLDEEDAEAYKDVDKVTLQLPEGDVDAEIRSIEKEGKYYKAVFYLNVYYEEFSSARKMDMTIVVSDNEGLIVDNECITGKDGVKGVYVKDKNGDYSFKPVDIKASNDSQSVVSDGMFINDRYEQVETVNVYDEVLRHPDNVQ